MPRAVFEPAIPATKRLQTYALDRAATGIGFIAQWQVYIPPLAPGAQRTAVVAQSV
jgi:hypothetical protein